MAIQTLLLTNDDGIHAPGLAALVASLSTRYRVHVVAPSHERSGVGHGFTLFNPLRADPVHERFPEGLVASAYACSGLPADCVKLGLLELLKEEHIDLVVSGVNKGANLGTDVIYSGTVAAAREAVLNGVPGVATSLVLRGDGGETSSHPHFAAAADWTLRLLQDLEAEIVRGARERYFLNVNVPNRAADQVDGWAWTDLAESRYDDRFVKHLDPSGRPHYWLEGELVVSDPREDADIPAVRAGRVSVSPVSALAHADRVLARLHRDRE